MKLSLENLISYFTNKYPYDKEFNSLTILRDERRACSFDGNDAIYLLESLSKKFNVNFENFDFQKYFLDESELNTMTVKKIFKLEKQREIKEELTIQMLFNYMMKNEKI